MLCTNRRLSFAANESRASTDREASFAANRSCLSVDGKKTRSEYAVRGIKRANILFGAKKHIGNLFTWKYLI